MIQCIDKVRSTIAGTALASTPVGHVDTYGDWTNTTNAALIPKVDWIGMNTFPYWQKTDPSNDIKDAPALFNAALDQVKAIANGKPIWITETGWPTAGETQHLAVPSPANAATFWKTVGCPLINKYNFFYFAFTDAGESPQSFNVVNLETLAPTFDMSCPGLSPIPYDNS